ncbi:MAG TPA: hypothetical protein VEU30_05315 [Thermoanaerobaculia bacterium]|nr:hypothetical protein [Thermoanaerobaculia bacterium]
MGNEVLTRLDLGAESAEAKALLETDELIVRGALKARIPFSEMKDVRAAGEVLELKWADRSVRLYIGARDAAKWAEKIRNPKSVLDKLGVKAGQRISVLGDAGELVEQLEGRGAEVSTRLRRDSDVIFLAASHQKDLTRLEELRRALAPAGAVWVLRPKGDPAISEADVMAAGKAAGLVDVKVVRFSATHTAEKLVIPLAQRA